LALLQRELPHLPGKALHFNGLEDHQFFVLQGHNCSPYFIDGVRDRFVGTALETVKVVAGLVT
jgi:hypothetical protein